MSLAGDKFKCYGVHPHPDPLPSMEREESARGGWEASIPDRSPGHAFVPIADAGWRRHTQV